MISFSIGQFLPDTFFVLYVIVDAENLREEKMKEEIEQQINNEARPRKVELKGAISWTEILAFIRIMC